MDILQITDGINEDISIEKYEYQDYKPISGTDLNSQGSDITIEILNQNQFLHPSKSYLCFEGQLIKTDDSLFSDDDVISLVNNAMMYLFTTIRYSLSGTIIESINNPGQATTMLGLLKYPDDFSKSKGLNQLWYKDTSAAANLNTNNGFAVRHAYIIKQPDPKGNFGFMVPMNHIFRFCEDYNKIVYGFTHTLTLIRKTDNDAIYRIGATDPGKILLKNVFGYMPRVSPSNIYELNLYKIIEQKSKLPVAYWKRECATIALSPISSYSWRLSVKSSPEKPRYIIVGFQTGTNNNQERNASIFSRAV